MVAIADLGIGERVAQVAQVGHPDVDADRILLGVADHPGDPRNVHSALVVRRLLGVFSVLYPRMIAAVIHRGRYQVSRSDRCFDLLERDRAPNTHPRRLSQRIDPPEDLPQRDVEDKSIVLFQDRAPSRCPDSRRGYFNPRHSTASSLSVSRLDRKGSIPEQRTRYIGKGSAMSVTVAWGHADQFWDVTFEEGVGLSVHVDEATGAVTLNRGYAPGSREDAREEGLFNEHQSEIEGQLLAALADNEDPGYAAFKARHLSVPGMSRH